MRTRGTRRLGRLLLASHVGLALLLCALLLATGAGTIRAALQDRARAQVVQAAAEGLARLEDQRRDLRVVALLLSERPTLQRYLRQDRRGEAAAFVETFRRSAGVDAIRVERGGEVYAAAGAALPPDMDVAGLHGTGDGGFWLLQPQAMEGPADARVVVARRLGSDALGALGDGGAVQVALVDPQAAPAGDDPLRRSYRHVQATARAETAASRAQDILRIEPVRAAGGGVEALVVASRAHRAVVAEGMRWLVAFAVGSLLVTLAAALAAVWLARRIAAPFAQVAASAERLGAGDLATAVPVPAADLAEPQALSRSLESMRLQLRAATATERAQREELDSVLESVGDGIVAIAEDDTIQYANRPFLALVGREAADVLGQAYPRVLPPAADAAGAGAGGRRDPFVEARRLGLAQARCRYAVDGRVRSFVVRSTAPPGGRQVAILREETGAEAAQSMRDAILANLSHEFQTPLAAQTAAVEMLREHVREGGDAVAARLADALYRSVLRLSQLVENLLDSVRLDSGEMRLRREDVDLPALVGEAVELMRPLLEQRDQQVQLDLPAATRRLVGDRQRLFQVVVNLLANANKFAPDQSTIRVELVWGADEVALWVEDEGQGLPPLRDRADLFAPFRRAPEQEPSQRGTGLGLAIVRAMVERHRGAVVLAEPRRGRGARIGIALPLEPA
ncbi:sensor histidine kinase [Coralloluteibacterium stylophorae]|uniref:histidine kinase n=1 Tax=Coralloluteibacterium stylophorae TaxID=1776034 RepID=A0A8J7VR77_9GAMM|nr:ATP-binding protein [Coralloluteibacterium stylophorae]MBS7456963.1 PAS domain-containing protein [Coralloluteibacterium stylophorae]